MQFAGILVIFIGAYLVDSAVKNRDPIGTLRQIIANPGNVTEILSDNAGKWTTLPASGAGSATSTDSGSTGSAIARKGESGHLPASALAVVPGHLTQRLVPGAAADFAKMEAAYRAQFGTSITITDSYRSYAQQVATKAGKGVLAATPGKSNHGWGIAVDLGGGINKFGTPQYNWMKANAARYNWAHPAWAEPGGSKPEPWHWEWVG